MTYTKKKIGSDRLRKMREYTRQNDPQGYEEMHDRSVKIGLVLHALDLFQWKIEGYVNTVNKCLKGLVISEQLKSVRMWLNRSLENLTTANVLMKQHYVADEHQATGENGEDYIWLSECIDTVLGFDEEGNYITGKSIAIVDNKILAQIDSMIASGMLKKEEFKVIFNQVSKEDADASYGYKPTEYAKKKAS